MHPLPVPRAHQPVDHGGVVANALEVLLEATSTRVSLLAMHLALEALRFDRRERLAVVFPVPVERRLAGESMTATLKRRRRSVGIGIE